MLPAKKVIIIKPVQCYMLSFHACIVTENCVIFKQLQFNPIYFFLFGCVLIHINI